MTCAMGLVNGLAPTGECRAITRAVLMSIECVRAVLESGNKLKGNARLLMLAIAEHADKDGIACPGNILLASETAMCERQVQRQIVKLAESGDLEIIQVGNGRGIKRILRIAINTLKGDTICHPLIAKEDAEQSVKGDNMLSPFSEKDGEKRVTFETKKGDISSVKGDIFDIKGDIAMSPEPLTNNQLLEPTAREHARKPLVTHKPRFSNNSTSTKRAQPPIETDSPHVNDRLFVNGFIPAGKGGTAVEIFYERYSIRECKLSAPLEDDIAAAVTDLELWRSVVVAWQKAGYKPTNLTGQLDWYRGGIPGLVNGATNGQQSNSHRNGTGKGQRTYATYEAADYDTDREAELNGWTT